MSEAPMAYQVRRAPTIVAELLAFAFVTQHRRLPETADLEALMLERVGRLQGNRSATNPMTEADVLVFVREACVSVTEQIDAHMNGAKQ